MCALATGRVISPGTRSGSSDSVRSADCDSVPAADACSVPADFGSGFDSGSDSDCSDFA